MRSSLRADSREAAALEWMADAIFRNLLGGLHVDRRKTPAVLLGGAPHQPAPAPHRHAPAPARRDVPTAAAARATAAPRAAGPHGDTSDEDGDDGEGGVTAGATLFASSKRPRVDGVAAGAAPAAAAAAAPGGSGGSHGTTAGGASDEVRAFRKRLAIRVLGADVPDPMATWAQLPEDVVGSGIAGTLVASSCVRAEGAPVVRAVAAAGAPPRHRSLGAAVAARHAAVRRAVLAAVEASAFAEPTAVQMQAAPVLLCGRDLLAVAPTGSGKTAAYALPLIVALQGHAAAAGPRALVLVPTKELAAQVAREAGRLAAGTGVVVGALTREAAEAAAGLPARGLSVAPAAAAAGDGDAAGAGGARAGAPRTVVAPHLPRFDILVATPLTLLAALRHASTAAAGNRGDPPPRAILPCLRFLVLDEADRLLDDGFVEQLDAVMGARPDAGAVEAWLREEEAEAEAERAAGGSGGSGGPRRARHSRRALDAARGMLHGWTMPAPQPPQAMAAAAVAAVSSSKKRRRDSAAAAAAAATAPPPPLPSLRVCVAMFTATMPSGAEALAASVLHDHVRVLVGASGAAPSAVSQRLLFTGREEGKLLALRQLAAEGGLRPPCLVFVQSKERADELAAALRTDLRLPAAAAHADMAPAARAAALTSFRAGDTWVLVTTDLLGRGMDFPAVRLVINYDLPRTAVSYIHRIGRTGRGGREGDALTLFTEADIPALRSIAHVMRLSGCAGVPQWMLDLPRPGRDGRGAAAERSTPHRAPIFRQRTKFDAAQAAKARAARVGGGGGYAAASAAVAASTTGDEADGGRGGGSAVSARGAPSRAAGGDTRAHAGSGSGSASGRGGHRRHAPSDAPARGRGRGGASSRGGRGGPGGRHGGGNRSRTSKPPPQRG